MKLIVVSGKKVLSKTFILLGILLVLTGSGDYYQMAVGENITGEKKSITIAIDPGHGGFDPGAVGRNGVGEKNINLAIALRLKNLIESSGGAVVMTREADEGLDSIGGSLRDKKNEDLSKRKKILNEGEVDVFVSIHLNSFGMSNSKGAQVFYMDSNETSHELARSIQGELKAIIDPNNNRVASAIKDVYIMKNCTVPGVIVECGFLSNSNEEKLLQMEDYQEKLAWSIFSGIYKYYFGIKQLP